LAGKFRKINKVNIKLPKITISLAVRLVLLNTESPRLVLPVRGTPCASFFVFAHQKPETTTYPLQVPFTLGKKAKTV
jgi:hypothetical protein